MSGERSELTFGGVLEMSGKQSELCDKQSELSAVWDLGWRCAPSEGALCALSQGAARINWAG